MPCLAQPEAGLAGEFGVIFDEEKVHAGGGLEFGEELRLQHSIPPPLPNDNVSDSLNRGGVGRMNAHDYERTRIGLNQMPHAAALASNPNLHLL